jgi:hypothetical protein
MASGLLAEGSSDDVSEVSVADVSSGIAEDVNPLADSQPVLVPEEGLPSTLPIPLVEVEEPPKALPASPVIITSYRVDDGRLSFVQLYNNSSSIIKLDDWRVEYTLTHPTEASIVLPIQLTAWLPAHQYAVYGQIGLALAADAEYDMPPTSGYVVEALRIISANEAYAPYQVTGGLFLNHERYDLSVSTAGNYTSTSKYKEMDRAAPLYGGALYMYPPAAEFKIVEILAHANDCSPVDADAACGDYIKLFNPTAEQIVLEGYRLRVGYQGQSSSVSNAVALRGALAPGAYGIVDYRDDGQALAITNTGGYAWIEDMYGLRLYESTIQSYEDSSAALRQGQSWALNNDTWMWAVPSPYGMNTFVTVDDAPQLAGTTLQPCKDNQYRSEETNRCRTIVATAVSVPCKDGQYRSEETNRCRNIALAGSTLVECGDDQYRSEATNRCRNIVTLTGTLTPCKDNQYRSEETNRCRNITTSTVPAAAFAVESTPDTGKVFVGWYALGGVGALAVAYGVWEWRSEAMAAVRRIASFFTKQ